MSKKISIVLLAIVGAAIIAGAMPASVKAITIDEIKQQIATLQAQITQLIAQLAEQQGGTTAPWCHNFNTNLGVGSNGEEVAFLQTALEKEGLYQSQGKFGFDENIASAVVGLQEKYASEILTPSGLKHGTGYVGKSTRAKLNKLYGCGQSTNPPQPVSCLQEGEEGIPTAALYKSCCSGLVSIGKSSDYDASCNLTPDAKIAMRLGGVCTACGNGVCGTGENQCNCPSDCKTTATTTKSITVVSPNGGETLISGNSGYVAIKWQSTSIDKVDIRLFDYSYNNSQTSKIIAENIDGKSGVYYWSAADVANTFNSYFKAGDNYKIIITEKKSDGTFGVQDESDNYFFIDKSSAQGSLNISLASDNPVAQTILAGLLPSQYSIYGVQELTPVLKVKFTNSGNSSIKVTSINFRQKGLSNASDIAKASLLDGDNFLADYSGYADAYGWNFSNNQGVFEISAQSSKTLTLKIKLADNTIAGKTMYFGIDEASDVGPSAGVAVMGSFPLWGNTMTTARADATKSITIVSPNGGEKWEVGKTYEIQWKKTGVIATDSKINIDLVDYSLNNTKAIAHGVSISDFNSYVWYINPSLFTTSLNSKVKITEVKSNGAYGISDESDSYFTIISQTTSENLPPVIDGITAPTQLKVNEQGTWTIKAHDPENGTLDYAVSWGDTGAAGWGMSNASGQSIQTNTLNHTYSKAGTYTVTFTITDNNSKSAKTSSTVNVIENSVAKFPPCGSYGDLDKDDYVTKADSDLVMKIGAELIQPNDWQKKYGDVSGDGTVEAYDAALIMQYNAGIISTFPVCSKVATFSFNLKNGWNAISFPVKPSNLSFQAFLAPLKEKNILAGFGYYSGGKWVYYNSANITGDIDVNQVYLLAITADSNLTIAGDPVYDVDINSSPAAKVEKIDSWLTSIKSYANSTGGKSFTASFPFSWPILTDTVQKETDKLFPSSTFQWFTLSYPSTGGNWGANGAFFVPGLGYLFTETAK
ncbi:MAG: PKD domain-containing protein [Candidatus Gribaldobacteria bacterium]|nr:PKD domain-containing protein [Candidatus Gribaldobacteria bacterium]